MSKMLKDGTNVPDRIWYYLLDFLDKEKGEGNYLTTHIRQLNREEISKLFSEATEKDKNWF